MQVNFFAVILFVMMLFISIFNAIMQGQYKFGFGSFMISVTRFIILLSFLIPISLKLYLIIARFGYSNMISTDKEIDGTVCKNETIVDELGKIEVILSDKTGTITQNIMYMDKISIGENVYYKTRFQKLIRDYYESPEENKEIKPLIDLSLSLVICNNVSMKMNEGKSFFDASSPDEIAMVEFFEELGFKILERNDSKIIFKTPTGQEINYKIVEIFPFESARKRMGIIVEEFDQKGDSLGLSLHVKGADNVMKRKVATEDDTLFIEENTLALASEGLRTLVFASKTVTQDQLDEYRDKCKENMIAGNKHLNEELLQNLEAKMTYLGITAVKDLLQDDVQKSFTYIQQAQLKLWILTGDKLETAKHICLSTGLAKRNRPLKELKIENNNEFNSFITNNYHKNRPTRDIVLVIDGELLGRMLKDHPLAFLEACFTFDYICFARCTPAQKYEIAKLLKDKLNKIILAVGDGGNDVGMIQIANVGIGIYGREGNQAALAADFTVNKFNYLCKLIFFHGRNAHMGISSISQFVLHRGLIISWLQEIFSALFFMISMPIFNGMMVMLYSAVFTVLPALSVVYDYDISWEQLKDYLGSYRESGSGVSSKNFLIWCCISFYQASAIFISALKLFDNYLSNFVGITFTALILAETFNIIFLINKCSRMLIASIVSTLLLYIICVFIFPSDFDINIFDIDFLSKVSVVFMITWLPIFCLQLISRHFYKNVGDLVR